MSHTKPLNGKFITILLLLMVTPYVYNASVFSHAGLTVETIFTQQKYNTTLTIDHMTAVSITNNRFENISGLPAVGISISHSNHILIDQNSFFNFSSNSQVAHITISNSDNVTIQGNNFSHQRSGNTLIINIFNSTRINIKNNTYTVSNSDDVQLFHVQLSDEVVILNNTIFSSGGSHIEIAASSNVHLLGNSFESSVIDTFVRVENSAYVEFTSNTFEIDAENEITVIEQVSVSESLVTNNRILAQEKITLISSINGINTKISLNTITGPSMAEITLIANTNSTYFDNMLNETPMPSFYAIFSMDYKKTQSARSFASYTWFLAGQNSTIYEVRERDSLLLFESGTFNDSIQLNVSLPTRWELDIMFYMEDIDGNTITIYSAIVLVLIFDDETSTSGDKRIDSRLNIGLSILIFMSGSLLSYKTFNMIRNKPKTEIDKTRKNRVIAEKKYDI